MGADKIIQLSTEEINNLTWDQINSYLHQSFIMPIQVVASQAPVAAKAHKSVEGV